MEKINEKVKIFLDALATLEESVGLFYEYKDICTKNPTKKMSSYLQV